MPRSEAVADAHPAPVLDQDLGWLLATGLRAYLRGASQATLDLPGGPRGYQVLASAARGELSSQSSLALRLGVDKTVMTYLLDDLVKAGLVERQPDPADRRSRRVIATESGRERLTDLHRQLTDVESEVLAPLEEEDRVALKALLQRVAANLDRCGSAAQDCEPGTTDPC